MLIGGKRCPILGRICMDQLMADVTALDQVRVGDTVTLIGRDGEEEITADELAEKEGTINYEVVCALSKRVPRVYVKNGKVDSIYDALLGGGEQLVTALLASRSAAHFAVDLACGFVCLGVFVPGAASLEEAALGVFLYNLLAFATQPLLGGGVRPVPPAALGGPWLPDGGGGGVAGVPLPWAGGRWSSAGLGNAPVPPWRRPGRPGLLLRHLVEGGVFVSTGALGVAPWACSGGAAFPRPWIAAALAALLGLCALFCWKTPLSQPERGERRFPGLPPCPSGGWWGWLWGRWRSGPL